LVTYDFATAPYEEYFIFVFISVEKMQERRAFRRGVNGEENSIEGTKA